MLIKRSVVYVVTAVSLFLASLSIFASLAAPQDAELDLSFEIGVVNELMRPVAGCYEDRSTYFRCV